MITFKQFLAEKAMNRGVYRSTLDRVPALLGLEVELRVDPANALFIEGPKDNWTPTAEELAAVLKDELKIDAMLAEPYGKTTEYWKLVPDSSITDGIEHKATMTGIGIEIVSPPLEVKEGLKKLKQLFALMERHNLQTNSTTGLHINLSVPNIQELDALKLVLFMGDEHVLKQFNRLTNRYSRPQMEAIVDGIQINGKPPTIAHELLDLARSSVDNVTKNRSVNLARLMSKGYIEFRSIGGTNYHRRFDEIEDIVGRWLRAIELACDPSAERQEYMKKVVKLLGYTFDERTKNQLTDYSAEELLKKHNREAFMQLTRSEDPADRLRLFALLAVHIAGEASKAFEPTFKQIKDMRQLMSLYDVGAKELLASANNERSSSLIKRFLTMFRLQK